MHRECLASKNILQTFLQTVHYLTLCTVSILHPIKHSMPKDQDSSDKQFPGMTYPYNLLILFTSSKRENETVH